MSVEINATNFPDAQFRSYVSTTFDPNNTGYLSDETISETTTIEIVSGSQHLYQGLADLTGIEYFVNCETLLLRGLTTSAGRFTITNIDISALTKLTSLNFEYINLNSSLDITNNTELTSFVLKNSTTTLNTIDVSHNVKLRRLYIQGFNMSDNGNPGARIGITSLDVSDLSNLLYLYLFASEVGSLDLSNSPDLVAVSVMDDPNIHTLDIGNNPELITCNIACTSIASLDISGCPKLLEQYQSGYPELLSYKGTNYYDYNSPSGGLQINASGVTIVTEAASLPVIVTQPQSASVIEGEDVTFSISASGNDLSYQWEVSIDDGETWADIRGAAVPSFSFAASLGSNGNKVRCKVTNLSGSVYSDTATLTVEEDTRLSAPVIDTQPSSVSVAEGSIASFSLSASGDNLNYQWQLNQNGTWYSISGATSASYSITASLALNGARYRCQVSNAAGSVYSTEATLSVTGRQSVTTPTVTSNPRSVTVEEGQLASFRVLATGGSLSYQWQVKRNNTWYAISGATSQILSIRAASDTNGNQYRCQVSNAAGVAYSAVATLTVSESTPLTFYGYHSIIISGKNTYGEWQMYPTSRPHVAPPEVKTSYVDVPGADGGLDYTELLNGKPNYGYRKGSWEFLLIPQEKWPEVYRSLCNFLHGREHTIVLEDDPKWVYRGRLSVNEWRSAAHNSLITIDYILEPIATSTDDEGYDPDADDLDAAGRILRKPGNENSAIILWNGTETVVPIDSLYEDGDNILY